MLLFIASLVLLLVGWLSTREFAPLPPSITFVVVIVAAVACGVASITGSYGRFHSKVLALLGCTVFTLAYPLHWSVFTGLVPEGEYWPAILLTMGLVVPAAMVFTGPLLPVLKVGRE